MEGMVPGSWASKTKPDCRTSYTASGVGVIKAVVFRVKISTQPSGVTGCVAASPGITRGTGFFSSWETEATKAATTAGLCEAQLMRSKGLRLHSTHWRP